MQNARRVCNTDNVCTDLYILLKPQSELGYLGFYLAKINELLSKIIVNMSSRFHSDMPRLNSLEILRYLTMNLNI